MKKGDKILVTGGTGYIGSHTVLELLDQGFEVVIVDNLSNSDLTVLQELKRISGRSLSFYPYNIREMSLLHTLMEQEPGISAIVHFAASKAVGESVQQPLAYYRNNVEVMMNLLELMQLYRIRHLVFSSSCTVYGQPEQLPVTEQAAFKPASSPYGRSKQICEDMIADTMHAAPQCAAIALRYFNPVGAHPSGLIGERPTGVPNNLVPYLTQVAAGKQAELKIFGGDYASKDGTAVRDYIHVCDLARAHVLALKRLREQAVKKNYEFFNLGSGQGYTVLELVESFERVNGLSIPYRIVPRRQGDIEQIYADTTLAATELGWSARHNLDDMMRSAWNWQRSLMEKERGQTRKPKMTINHYPLGKTA